MTSTDGLETERTACSKERSKRKPAYDPARASSFSKKDELATYYAKVRGVPRAMSKTDLDPFSRCLEICKDYNNGLICVSASRRNELLSLASCAVESKRGRTQNTRMDTCAFSISVPRLLLFKGCFLCPISDHTHVQGNTNNTALMSDTLSLCWLPACLSCFVILCSPL